MDHQVKLAEPGLEKNLLLDGGPAMVKPYLDYMIDVAVLFGANRTKAAEEFEEVVQFEAALTQQVGVLPQNFISTARVIISFPIQGCFF